MAKPDLTRNGFRGPRSLNDLARAKAKFEAFRRFPKVVTGNNGSNVESSAGLSPSYSLAGNSIIVEDDISNTYTVTTTNVSDGTTLYWRILNATTDDFAAVSGSFTVTSNTGQFNIAANQDNATEGNESFDLQISSASDYSNIVATKGITISDTSTGAPSPSYSVSGASSSVDEGSSLTINVTTSNVADGTTLYWTIGTNAGDFSTTNGSFTINSNAGSFTVTPTADSATEGSETFQVQIRTGSTSGTVVATTTITINDTSTGPTPTYTASPATASVDEGSSLTMNVTTTNVSDATTLYWTIGNNASDFGTTSGSFTITSNAGSFTVTPTADTISEGSETFTVQIRTGSTSGPIVDTTGSITINDTSQTPTSLTVTVVSDYGSNKFVVEGSSTYDLSFTKGTTYTFDVSDSTNGTHPLSFSETSGGGAYSGVSNNGISAGTAGATVTLAIDANYSGSEIYMYCTSHGVGMGSYYNPIPVF